ncbi:MULTISPECIES: arsenate reductase/protein-tyrosine-phosphatase family protein [Paraburkholderia]|uniref:arsenate reductase/protein-tyrosine-phosphatase family protein n=1 Tax=Paraburkholderia TaxID=1822464 RepID=UPI0022594841|nr:MULTISPECIES: low molecular weight phosphotyrosine protein phosphatase [Paraburkholderia]MCX4175809.1 low molecular weight phosphotyrosine protein phosphatase [Paraburkholderia madseniana]MDQ6463803.1 low molecular weight phosphotyrosine protein phosphatase [Paraburkholderia madseniana]
MNLLLICHANVCRSRIAECVFRHVLSDAANVSVQSAGLEALSGVPMPPILYNVLVAKGYAIPADSSSMRLTMPMLHWADLVLVMETGQRYEVLRRYPFATGKVWTLGHWLGSEVHDPVGGDQALFEASLALIERSADSWLPALTMQPAI